MYSSHNSNIKCVDLTTKCIGFESFHYAMNLDVVSSFVVFSDFNFMFLSMYSWLELMKLFFSSIFFNLLEFIYLI